MSTTEELAPVRLQNLDQALLTRHHVERIYLGASARRIDQEIQDLNAEISDHQRRFEILKEKLAGLSTDLAETSARHAEASRIVKSIVRRILDARGVETPEDAFDLETSPNGTVFALTPRGD